MIMLKSPFTKMAMSRLKIPKFGLLALGADLEAILHREELAHVDLSPSSFLTRITFMVSMIFWNSISSFSPSLSLSESSAFCFLLSSSSLLLSSTPWCFLRKA